MSDRIQQILQDLGRAVAGAMHGADPVHDVVRRLRRRGYELDVLLRATPEDDPTARLGVGALQLAARPATADDMRDQPADDGSTAPTFRLGADDAKFLRELGIDPTRTGKSRRR